MPGNAGSISTQRWHTHAVVSSRIDLQKWFFANDGSERNLGIGRGRPLAGRRIGYADKDHVPVGAGPFAPLGVARNPLLLRSGIDGAIDQIVGHPATAGPSIELVQNDGAANMHASKRRGLRDCPSHRTAGRVDGDTFGAAPECCGGVVVIFAGIRMQVAIDFDVVGRGAKPHYLRVETNRDIDLVLAGKEKQGIALRAKLVSPLNGVDLVNLLLHRGYRHCRSEDQNIRPEIRLGAAGSQP